MATETQMYADPYYQAEIVPGAMDWLGDELCRSTGRPRTAAGTKGDWRHQNGAHRSQRFVLYSQWCTNHTYTVDLGLAGEALNWVSGFDFTPGSTEQMIAQSRRLVAAMKAGLLDEVEAIYCNVDGDQVVDGWDNVRDRAATSDTSHLWHWHLTIKRRFANSMDLMRRILGYALGTLSIIKGVIDMGMQVLAKDLATGKIWLCDGMTRRVVGTSATDPAVTDLLYLGKVGAMSVFTGNSPGGETKGSIWQGVSETFGVPLSAAPTVDVPALASAIVAKLPATSLTAADVRAALADVLRHGVATEVS